MASSSYCYSILCLSVFTNICISSVFSSSPSLTSVIPYSDHCASIVPESVTSYYTGGNRLLGWRPSEKPRHYITKSLKLLITRNDYGTDPNLTYKFEGSLYIRSPYRYYGSSGRSASITFFMNGFWSVSSRKLCMVGSGSSLSDEGEAVDLGAVLKLRFANDNPTSISSSFVSGVLESTNSANESAYFDPLLIFSFPVLPMFNYSLFSRQLENGFSGDIDIPRNESLNLEPTKFCSMLFGRYFVFEMEYMEDCKTSTNCSPLGDGFLPSFVSLDMIHCSMTRRKVRYTVRFRNITRGVFDQDFDPGWMLIGEGSWDEEKRRILVAACPILQADDDCRIRLSLRYPSTWNIRDDAKIVGHIWTNRTANESAYFREIKLRSSDENDMVVSPGLRYEYTELERARKSCKLIQKKTNNRYPDIDSDDLKFDIYVKNSKGQQFAWGDALPLSVVNEFYQQTREPFSEKKKKNVALVDISYKIGISPSRKIEFHNWSSSLYLSMNLRSRVEITAEGVYDAEAGQICMIGCRKLFSYNDGKSTNDSTDCEIIVNLEFAPLDARRGGLSEAHDQKKILCSLMI